MARKKKLPPIVTPVAQRGTLNKIVGGPAAQNVSKVKAIASKKITGKPGSAARATQVKNKRKALNFMNRLLPRLQRQRRRKSLLK